MTCISRAASTEGLSRSTPGGYLEREEVDMSSGTNHGHDTEPTGYASVPWSVAASATLHCLTGCAIGEVLGMVIGTAVGLHNAATVVLSIVLAFVFGYALTMRGVLRAGVRFGDALRIALAADTVSIAVIEIIDNADRAQRSRSHGCRSRELAVLGVAGLRPRCGVPGYGAGEPVDDRPRRRARRGPRLPPLTGARDGSVARR